MKAVEVPIHALSDKKQRDLSKETLYEYPIKDLYMKPNNKLLLSLLAVLLLSVFPLTLSAKTLSSMDLIDGDFNARSKTDRLLIAIDLAKSIYQLNAKIPSISRDEKHKIAQEQHAIDSIRDKNIKEQRIATLVNTPDFQQEKLKEYLSDVNNTLTCIKTEVVVSHEMYCWSYLGFLLTNPVILNDAMLVLEKSGKLPKSVDPDLMREQYNWYGRGILQYIIIPYIGGEMGTIS